jgi:hypothetical protein
MTENYTEIKGIENVAKELNRLKKENMELKKQLDEIKSLDNIINNNINIKIATAKQFILCLNVLKQCLPLIYTDDNIKDLIINRNIFKQGFYHNIFMNNKIIGGYCTIDKLSFKLIFHLGILSDYMTDDIIKMIVYDLAKYEKSCYIVNHNFNNVLLESLISHNFDIVPYLDGQIDTQINFIIENII